jgi:arylsulfatase A-like enzyme
MGYAGPWEDSELRGWKRAKLSVMSRRTHQDPFGTLRGQLAVVGLCWLVASIFDLAVALGLGAPVSATYYGIYLLSGLAVAAAIASAGRLLSLGPQLVLAAWVGANAYWSTGVYTATLLACSVWGTVKLRQRREGPIALASRTGLAVALVLCLWPELKRRLPVLQMGGAIVDSLVPAALFLAAFVTVSVAQLSTQRLRLAPQGLLALLFLPLGMFAAGLYYTHLADGRRPPVCPSGRGGKGMPDIVLIVLDTVRADRMSVYGYARPTTPRLEKFVRRSRRAVTYPLALSPGNWTLPSHASLFTGLLPSQHGSHMRSAYAGSGGKPRFIHLQAEETLAELLHSSGYRTAAVIANGMLFMDEGLKRGFDWWVKPFGPRRPQLAGADLVRLIFEDSFAWRFVPYPAAPLINLLVLDFMKACDDVPAFVFANYMEAHAPYIPPRAQRGRFSQKSDVYPSSFQPGYRDSKQTLSHFGALYDEEILALDEALGQLLDGLEASGRLEDSWLIITSDHGESFGEHGVTEHGTSVYNEQVRIPLIIQPPAGTQLVPKAFSVSLLDVAATIAGVAGYSGFGIGQNLRIASGSPKPSVVEFLGDPRSFRSERYGPLAALPAKAVVWGTRKIIDYGDRFEVYDLERDPSEQRDESLHTDPEIIRQLRSALKIDDSDTVASPGTGKELTPHQLELLRSLGYIE